MNFSDGLPMFEERQNRNPVDVLGEEYLKRRRCGEPITVNEFANMHPEFADDIRQTASGDRCFGTF